MGLRVLYTVPYPQGGTTRVPREPRADFLLADKPGGLLAVNTVQRGKTALVLAAQSGSAKMIALLVKHGAKVDAQAADGTTPLVEAAASGMGESVKALLNAGANITTVQSLLGHKYIDTTLGYARVYDGTA